MRSWTKRWSLELLKQDFKQCEVWISIKQYKTKLLNLTWPWGFSAPYFIITITRLSICFSSQLIWQTAMCQTSLYSSEGGCNDKATTNTQPLRERREWVSDWKTLTHCTSLMTFTQSWFPPQTQRGQCRRTDMSHMSWSLMKVSGLSSWVFLYNSGS